MMARDCAGVVSRVASSEVVASNLDMQGSRHGFDTIKVEGAVVVRKATPDSVAMERFVHKGLAEG